MSLLREIQAGATSESTELSTVLRKCRILAARLRHDGLKKWTQFELDGYPPKVELPEYRILGRCHSFGNFFGLGGAKALNAPIPYASIPKDFRDLLTVIHFRNGVASLQDMVRNAEQSTLQNRWPADANRLFGNSIMPGMALLEAWNEVPTGFVIGMLDSIRNRVLNFALEIEAENPDAGDVSSITTPMQKSKIQQIFNTTIYGNAGNVAQGSQHFSQSATIEIVQGDFDALSRQLKELGLRDADIKELGAAIKTDGEPKKKTLGKKVSDWFGKVISKAARGTLKVGSDVAAKVISEALGKFFGWPSASH